MSGKSNLKGCEGDNVKGDVKPDLEAYLKECKLEMSKMKKEMDEKAEKIALKEGVLEKKVDPRLVTKIQDQIEMVQLLMNRSMKEVKKMEVIFEKEDKDPSQKEITEESDKHSQAKEDQRKKSSKPKKKSSHPQTENQMKLNINEDKYLMEVHQQVELFLLRELQKKQKDVLTKFDRIIEQTNMIEKGAAQQPAAPGKPSEEEPRNILEKVWSYLTSFFYGN